MHVCILGMIAPHPCAHGIQVVEFPSGLDVGKEPVQKSENIICEDQHLSYYLCSLLHLGNLRLRAQRAGQFLTLMGRYDLAERRCWCMENNYISKCNWLSSTSSSWLSSSRRACCAASASGQWACRAGLTHMAWMNKLQFYYMHGTVKMHAHMPCPDSSKANLIIFLMIATAFFLRVEIPICSNTIRATTLRAWILQLCLPGCRHGSP